MREVGTLFSAPMVRALLDGRKTVTRRVIKPQPAPEAKSVGLCSSGEWLWEHGMQLHRVRPPCLAGDRIWVRETWQAVHFEKDDDDLWHPEQIPKTGPAQGVVENFWQVLYAATDPRAKESRQDRGFPWRSGRFMPRWASRILPDVVDVRAERLWDLTEEDAAREGVTPLVGLSADQTTIGDHQTGPHRVAFAVGWDTLNHDRGFPWVSNPWVWRIEMRRTGWREIGAHQ